MLLAAGSYISAVDRDAAQVLITPLARAMLRPFGAVVLPGADERSEPGKRDFGGLLHAVLQRFHDERSTDRAPAEEHQRLLALEDQVAAETQLDGPSMLPFRAGMPAFAHRYLQWLALCRR